MRKAKQYSILYSAPVWLSGLLFLAALFAACNGAQSGTGQFWAIVATVLAATLFGLSLVSYSRWRHQPIVHPLAGIPIGPQQKDSDERFEVFMDNSPAVAWIKDNKGSYTYANHEFCQKFGLKQEDIIGKTDNDLLDHDVVALINEDDNYVVESGEKKEIYEDVPTPDGVMRNWWVHKFPVLGSGGEVFTGGIGFDVTAKAKAEMALAESEKRYRLISENTRDLVCLHKKDSVCTYVSPSVSDFAGYSPDELLGKTISNFFAPGDAEKINRAFASLKGENLSMSVFTMLKKDGGSITVEMTLQPILSESGDIVQVQTVSRDISHRIATEKEISRYLANLEGMNKELTAAKEIAEKSVRIKEEFLANTSHEIRTPMNAIIGLTRLLLDSPLNTEQKEYLESISKSGETLLVVLNDILDLSKIEAGKMTFEEISFSPRESVRFTMDLLRPKAAEKGLKFDFSVDGTVPLSVVGDPIRLNQVLINMLSNAIKFTHHGGVTLNLSLLESPSDCVSLAFTVQDSGIGIAQERQESIFSSFTQGNSSITRKYGGTGLGLAIVKKLVELQGGNVKVSSEINNGSTFTIDICYKKDDIGLQTTLNFDGESHRDALLGKWGLLVEDNVINQLVSSKVLRDFGLNIDVANNGREAIRMLPERKYDIVIMDLAMPDMDGFEATRYIRNKMAEPNRSVPIIALTAHPMNGELEKCLKRGMNDYISKPFDINNLFHKIVKLTNTSTKMTTGNSVPAIGGKITDLNHLNQISEGSSTFFREILGTIIQELPKTIAELQEGFDKQDWTSVRFFAHKIKPSFGLIGVKTAETLMQKIEKNALEMPDAALLKPMIAEAVAYTTKSVEELKEELLHVANE